MSIEEPVEVECPDCGEWQKTTVWRTLNATLDPEAKDALLRGEINVFRCGTCDVVEPLPVDLLYHDMRKRFCVQFYPVHWLDDDGFFDRFTRDADLRTRIPHPLAASAEYIARAHIVFELGELVRYVVFRDRLEQHHQSEGRDTDAGESPPDTTEVE